MLSAQVRIAGRGFISDEIAIQLRNRPSVNRTLAEVVIDTLRYANQLANRITLPTLQGTNIEKQQVISLVLFVRLIEIFESIVVLAANGVREEQRSLFRIFLDAYFLLGNCCRAPNFFAVYFRSDDCERIKFMRAASKYKDDDMFEGLNEFAAGGVQNTIEEKVRQESIQAFNSQTYAKNVGCEKIYDSMYRLCSASVHTAPRCLQNYVENGPDGSIATILHQEDTRTTNRVLKDCEWFFLKAIREMLKLFDVHDQTAVLHFESALNDVAPETGPVQE